MESIYFSAGNLKTTDKSVLKNISAGLPESSNGIKVTLRKSVYEIYS